VVLDDPGREQEARRLLGVFAVATEIEAVTRGA
jgi:hypothetical protein